MNVSKVYFLISGSLHTWKSVVRNFCLKYINHKMNLFAHDLYTKCRPGLFSILPNLSVLSESFYITLLVGNFFVRLFNLFLPKQTKNSRPTISRIETLGGQAGITVALLKLGSQLLGLF